LIGRQPAHIAARFSVAHPLIEVAIKIRIGAIRNILIDGISIALRLLGIPLPAKPEAKDIKQLVQEL